MKFIKVTSYGFNNDEKESIIINLETINRITRESSNKYNVLQNNTFVTIDKASADRIFKEIGLSL